MGTRGTYGFRKNGVDKLTYNHYDSYPSGLGGDVLQFINNCSLQELHDIYDRIILVEELDETPTEEQIEECKQYADTSVATQSITNWYCLLRNAQGNLMAFKDGLRYMLNYDGFIKDSLFCEHGYIINLDTGMFEYWVGFQHKPQEGNRYGEEPVRVYEEDDRDRYYPCKLLLEIPIADLTYLDVDEVIKEMEELWSEDNEQNE